VILLRMPMFTLVGNLVEWRGFGPKMRQFRVYI
jgi:hypothetical protein